MTLDQIKFAAIVETAKAAAANRPEWLRAIEKAAAAILDGSMIVTVLAHGALVTTEGGTYHANGACDCPARTSHCYHRAAARLMERYEAQVLATKGATSYADVETAAAIAPKTNFEADVEKSNRKQLMAEIENIWPRACPGLPLYTELLARYGKSHLDMLDDDSLRRVRLAIAA